MSEPINRIKQYLEMRKAMPMPQLGDCIHCVNTGTEWEGELRLSDMRRLMEHVEQLEAAANEAISGKNLLGGVECVTISRKAYDMLWTAMPPAGPSNV